MGDITDNFSFQEFGCKCGVCDFSDGLYIDINLVKKLQMIREWIEEPLTINCGLRCPKHNQAAGGAEKSYHMYGMAADIQCLSSTLRLKIIQGAFVNNLTVGIYSRFLHLDMRPDQICFYGKPG